MAVLAVPEMSLPMMDLRHQPLDYDYMRMPVDVVLFDNYDASSHCRKLLNRVASVTTSSSAPFKWDVLEFMEESRQQLREIRKAHTSNDVGLWQEIDEALKQDQTSSTLPVGLRRQCEEMLQRRDMWLGDFDSELRAILARGVELRERLLFEDVSDAGFFSTSGVSPLEVQRLLERHQDMHQRAARLTRQLKLLGRALQQQGVGSRRRAFQAKTMGEKLQSSLVTLAAAAVAPVPGSSEMWLATTAMMWLDKDQAWQHVVYEHPRDADTETILSQFQCHSQKARQSVTSWLSMPPAARRNCVLIHNASVRRVNVKPHLVSCIDGSGESASDWTSALDSHPLGSVMKKSMTALTAASKTTEEEEDTNGIVIGAQRLAVVQLPKKPDANWTWRGSFAYGETKVGECLLREARVFSFICVDCGLFVGDMEEHAEVAGPASPHVSPTVVDREPLQVPPLASEPPKPPSTNPFDTQASTNPFEGSDFLGRAEQEVAVDAEKEKLTEDDAPSTAVEVVNRTDDPANIKIYDMIKGGHAASRWLSGAAAEGSLGPGSRKVFSLKGSKSTAETDFDVEIRIGMKKAKCEVVGGQVIFVDGILADG